MRQKIILPIVVLLVSAFSQSYYTEGDFADSKNLFSAYYTSLNDTSLNSEAFAYGFFGYTLLSESPLVKKTHLLTIIDYSLPSNANRFFVIDLSRKEIVFKTLVAHGRNSGDIFANRFSNRIQSHQSSLGFFITGNTYAGGQGYSLVMNGVDTGFNDNAFKRAIVIHGADYVSDNYIRRYGRLGRSFGCPALPLNMNKQVIDFIKDGSVVFCYFPDSSYIKQSSVLNRNKE